MSGATRISKIKFHSISRDVKSGLPTASVAIKQRVSESTVRSVRRAGTWPKYQAFKRKIADRTAEKRASEPRPTRVEFAKAAGLKPVTREQRIEDQFALELARIQREDAARGASMDEVRSLRHRIERLENLLAKKTRSFFRFGRNR
jgi:hypothetical protein